MDPNRLGIALGLPFPAAVLEVPDQFLLLGVDGNHRVAGGLVLRGRARDMIELGVAIRMLAALAGLARRLQAIVELCQKITDAPLTDLVTLLGQFLRQPRRALAGPP